MQMQQPPLQQPRQQMPLNMMGMPGSPQPIPLPQIDTNIIQSIQDINEKKNFIGNAIYPQISSVLGEQHAGKITGMLLDESVVEIDKLLKDQRYLTEKVYEAYNLILQTQSMQA